MLDKKSIRGLVLMWIVLFSFSFCKHDAKLFCLISSDHSGIYFNNKIVENDSINPMDVTNIYNGVGVGDFNGDGLQDLYFTGSMVSNKLYLNKANLRFEDITNSTGVAGDGKWCRGVAVVHINNNEYLDMYLVVNEILPNVNPSIFKPKITEGSFPSTGRLYRNAMDRTAGHPVFSNVTQ